MLGTAIGFSLQLVSAWVAPTQTPPNGNVGAPINTSGIGQIKAGGLMLNTNGAANGLIVDKGNVGIGTTSPKAKLDVEGKVLSESTSASDPGNTLVTKDYLDALSTRCSSPNYYLTKEKYDVSKADQACPKGYHVCSSREETFGRTYNKNLGNK